MLMLKDSGSAPVEEPQCPHPAGARHEENLSSQGAAGEAAPRHAATAVARRRGVPPPGNCRRRGRTIHGVYEGSQTAIVRSLKYARGTSTWFASRRGVASKAVVLLASERYYMQIPRLAPVAQATSGRSDVRAPTDMSTRVPPVRQRRRCGPWGVLCGLLVRG